MTVLDEVNEQQFGKKYADEEAAIDILGNARKKRLIRPRLLSSISLSTERTEKVIGPIARW